MTFAFLLPACSRRDPWQLQQIRTGNSAFNTSKLTWINPDRVNGLDLEMISSEEGLRMALVAHSDPIAPYALDEKKALVKISSAQKERVLLASRREGGQRILLPEETYPFILYALQEGQSVTFRVPGYRTTVQSKNFSTHLKKIRYIREN
ncbi:MAG: hypothetical protein ACHQT8_06195 [Chlamydiales bacterium]